MDVTFEQVEVLPYDQGAVSSGDYWITAEAADTTLDVFVFPSRVEAEGLVVLESNACETPVVGANAKGLKSTIEDDVNGYKYEPGNIDNLRDKVEKVYSDLEELKRSSVEKAEEIGHKKYRTPYGLLQQNSELKTLLYV
ncbi:MAG: glycosyltransferase [Candidatus Aenigmatarchaeota archaeon]